jgi:spermidine/putrescine transport system substrate-binding protein
MTNLNDCSSRAVGRRRFLFETFTALAGTATMLGGCSNSRTASESSARQLNIYSWPDYISPEIIPNFEKRYGIKVVYDTVSSNEGLLAKFQAGASNYDIVVPSGYMVKQLKKLDLLQKINKDKLPNFKNIAERFRNPAFDRHCEYSMPYTFGTTGIAFNKHAFGGQEKDEPHDWDAFWDKRAAGRMTLLDDPRETLGLALKRKGVSYNSTDPHLVEQACEDLKAQKPSVMCYTSDQVIVYLASGDSLLSLAFSGDAHQATRQNPDVKYIIPQSGASMWVDNMCIPKAAPHPDNAHLWLNYMMEPEVAASIANYTYYATPNQPALKLVKPEMLAMKSLYPDEELLDKCEEIDDIGSAIFLYDRMWTELKCA